MTVFVETGARTCEKNSRVENIDKNTTIDARMTADVMTVVVMVIVTKILVFEITSAIKTPNTSRSECRSATIPN